MKCPHCHKLISPSAIARAVALSGEQIGRRKVERPCPKCGKMVGGREARLQCPHVAPIKPMLKAIAKTSASPARAASRKQKAEKP